MTFDEWLDNPYTKVLRESIDMDYVPRSDLDALREACAEIADSFTCGTCGMDGKAGAAIRMRSNVK